MTGDLVKWLGTPPPIAAGMARKTTDGHNWYWSIPRDLARNNPHTMILQIDVRAAEQSGRHQAELARPGGRGSRQTARTLPDGVAVGRLGRRLRREIEQTQFLPSSYIKYGVDYDGNGGVDLRIAYRMCWPPHEGVTAWDGVEDKETLFNEVYDTEHVPNLLKVPGVHAVARMEGEPFAMSIGGEEKRVAHDAPRHCALYEIDGPDVLVSREWAKASEAGRWPSEVRPFTRNRRHALYKLR